MKRILVLANSSGGLYDFRNDFMKALLSAGELYISVPDTVKTDLLEAEGAKIIHTDINRHGVNPKEDFKLLMAYRKLMKQIKPDLVLTYTIKPDIYGGMAAASLKIPYIETVTGLGTVFEKKGVLLKLVITLYKLGLKKAECIFFQNRENRQLFSELGIEGKSSALVNGSGVDLEEHKPEPYPQGDETHFLYVGRVMTDKGIRELLEAAELIKKREDADKIFFEILGYCDEDYQELLDEKESLGIIKQLGFHPEVNEFLARASAIVIPSYHEGMCNSLTEASATARPVLASNISGCREVIDDGLTGYVFKPRDAKSLKEAFEKFLSLSVEERAQMGIKAREKMEAEFDRKEVTASYMVEVNKVLGI